MMMIVITQKNVRKDASRLSLCNIELRQEKMIPVLADNNNGALAKCSTKRKLAMMARALSIMTMPELRVRCKGGAPEAEAQARV